MKKIIAFAGSNSNESINKKLAIYVANKINNVEVEVLDLNDFNMPIYGIDLENKEGIPKLAEKFLSKIKNTDAIVLSLAEHNGAYATAFKNIFDWVSRIEGKLWSEKPMLLMASSPGARGGATVLEIAKGRFPYMGGNIVATVSFPSFHDNFKNGKVLDENLDKEIIVAVQKLEEQIH